MNGMKIAETVVIVILVVTPFLFIIISEQYDATCKLKIDREMLLGPITNSKTIINLSLFDIWVLHELMYLTVLEFSWTTSLLFAVIAEISSFGALREWENPLWTYDVIRNLVISVLVHGLFMATSYIFRTVTLFKTASQVVQDNIIWVYYLTYWLIIGIVVLTLVVNFISYLRIMLGYNAKAQLQALGAKQSKVSQVVVSEFILGLVAVGLMVLTPLNVCNLPTTLVRSVNELVILSFR